MPRKTALHVLNFVKQCILLLLRFFVQFLLLHENTEVLLLNKSLFSFNNIIILKCIRGIYIHNKKWTTKNLLQLGNFFDQCIPVYPIWFSGIYMLMKSATIFYAMSWKVSHLWTWMNTRLSLWNKPLSADPYAEHDMPICSLLLAKLWSVSFLMSPVKCIF